MINPVFSARILIVEDETFIAMMLQQELDNLGHYVTEVAMTEANALRSLTENRPDLVFLDYNLGEHTADRVAVELNTRAIPYIMCTALLPNVAQNAHIKPAGILAKPIDFCELKRLTQFTLQQTLPATAA